MADQGIYRIFKESHCDDLVVTTDTFPLGKSLSSKVRGCMKGKRARFPFSFGAAYPGEGKRKVGLALFLSRQKGDTFRIVMRWFITEADPPEEFGKVSDLFSCISAEFGQRKADVTTTFKYPKSRMESVFRPIQLGAVSTLFDEIVGFTGLKRDADGNLLYIMNVALGKKELTHVIESRQSIELKDELPIFLIPKAESISALALERKTDV